MKLIQNYVEIEQGDHELPPVSDLPPWWDRYKEGFPAECHHQLDPLSPRFEKVVTPMRQAIVSQGRGTHILAAVCSCGQGYFRRIDSEVERVARLGAVSQ